MRIPTFFRQPPPQLRRTDRTELAADPNTRRRLDDVVLKEWTARFGTIDELVLLASSATEAEHLNRTARSVLRSVGRLVGPSAWVAGVRVAVGDRVVAGPGGIVQGHAAIPEGCLGDVRLVSASGRTVVLDFPTAGIVRLSGAALDRPRLRYGYAVPAPPGIGRRMGSLRLAAPSDLGIDVAAG